MQVTQGVRREFDEYERVPSTRPCGACAEENKQHAEAVAAGGIYFKRTDCKTRGVIQKSPYADAIREIGGVMEGPVGVEFTKSDCPVCSKEQSLDG